MDVDVYSDEVIVYLSREIVNQIRSEGSVGKSVSQYGKNDDVWVEVNYFEKSVVDGEYYDDVMDALDEVYALLYELFELENTNQEAVEEMAEQYNWKEIMNTYEYYDDIRSEYE